MPIPLELYATQETRWPRAGRHVLAQYDDASVVVYQAYRPSIAGWALANGHLGGPEFSFSRMSWIKPNFLWMMYRSGWGTKPDQEGVLGLRIRRTFFDDLLRRAVPSTFIASAYSSPEEWDKAVRASSVRLQWDPDHLPSGAPTERRAIQLGLRGQALKELAGGALLEVLDMSKVVQAGRERLAARDLDRLETPAENVYAPPPDSPSFVRSSSDTP